MKYVNFVTFLLSTVPVLAVYAKSTTPEKTMETFRFAFFIKVFILGFLQQPGVAPEIESSIDSATLGCSIFDFEKSPLKGWTSLGDAFKYQPILEGNSPVLNHHGNWFIDSSSSMTSACQAHGNPITVKTKGSLMSPAFEIRSSNLTFLIGGGCDRSNLRLELIVEGLTVFNTSGNCKATMTRKFWNTGPYIGKLVQIKIVDDSAVASWGYISFDDLRTATGCEDIQPCQSNASYCFENSDKTTEVICRCSSRNVGPLPCGSSNDCSINNGNCQTNCTTSDCTCQECTCSSGYSFNSTSLKCEDIDECAKTSGGCQYACVNSLGGYHCTCQKGYRLVAADRKSCIDIDECSSPDNGGCGEHALCQNSPPGSYGCLCRQGWINNVSYPLQCIDKDECEESNVLCAASQTCRNTPGSYVCDCISGYIKVHDNCVDINECQTANGHCDHTCKNTVASFKCSCNHGYKLASDGKKCLDVNECEVNNGGCQQRCHNIDGSFKCGCRTGYNLSSDNITCIDINECDVGSKCTHTCNNTFGGYMCSCRHGYKLQPDNHTCVDVDECQSNNGNCDHGCHNNPGNFTCSCNRGYKLLGNGLACEDINECVINNQCQHECTNTKGNSSCSCFSGYALQNDGKRCSDVDECAKKPNELCQHNCENTHGSYRCLCPVGHILKADNKTCSDINECKNNATCQHTCTNLNGSFECGCHHGYLLDSDKRSCTDINECLQKGVCDQQCANTEGSYLCHCSNGYKLAYDNKTCADVNECQDDNAGCHETCTNSIGSYKCSCLAGKVLQSDGKLCKVPIPLNQALDSAKDDIKNAGSSSALAEITKTLSDSLADTKQITTSELVSTVMVMDQLQSKVMNESINSTVDQAKSLLKNYIKVMNNLLGPANKPSWQNVSSSSSGIGRLPTKVESFSQAIFNLVQDKNTSFSLNIKDDNIDLQLNVTRRRAFLGGQYISDSASVILGKSLVQDGSDNNAIVGTTVIFFKNISWLMSDDHQIETSVSNLNSDVISVKVHNVKRSYLQSLSAEPIVLMFNHLKPLGDVEPSCAFINDSEENLLSGQFWSSKGCRANSTENNVTVCMCNHTTSYGLLLDVHGIYDSLHDTHKKALRYISLIGCSISICFCVLTVVALTLTMRSPMEKKGRFETFKLHINLVVAIGLSQIWFVAGSFLVDVDLVACRVVSIFTHYFMTASFCWMLAEGINVYNKIVKVFSTKKYGKFYFTLGWGFPLAMVIVTSAAVFNKYGPQKICWLHKDVIWVFAVPVMVVIVANFFVLLSVVYVLLRKTMAFTAIPNKAKENPKVKRTVKVTVVLLPLLGLTWVFGFLAIDENFIVFHYLFAIINSLQGFFIFVAHCWINDSIRSALLNKLPSLPHSSKYRSSTKCGGDGGDMPRGSQMESGAYDTEPVSASVPMPVHITMSTVQILNLGKNSPEPRWTSEAINDCMEQDNQLPGFAQ